MKATDFGLSDFIKPGLEGFVLDLLFPNSSLCDVLNKKLICFIRGLHIRNDWHELYLVLRDGTFLKHPTLLPIMFFI